MKTKYIILSIFLLVSLQVFSCTTFVIRTQTDYLFGKNLDWFSDDGLIMINKRNQKKTSIVFPPDKPIEWISKYGSISFNQFGKEFPFGGINETGLVIELMLATASYPQADNRYAINELQWIQYHLDNSSSVQEVINADKKLRISPFDQELHFLIADKAGNIAVIEFIDGEMHALQGEDLPFSVLANESYAESIHKYRKGIDNRFTKTVNLVKSTDNTQINLIDYSFSILDSVAVNASWSIVYDIKNMHIYFKTETKPQIKEFSFYKFNYDNQISTAFCFDLRSNDNGDISDKFSLFSHKLNAQKLEEALVAASISISKKLKKRFLKYHKKLK